MTQGRRPPLSSEEYLKIIKAPCKIHGAVVREIETGWTGGPHYVCPRCKDDREAVGILSDALRRVVLDKTGWVPIAAAILGSAMRRLSKVEL